MNLILNRNRGETKAPLRLRARAAGRRAPADCGCRLIKAISYNVTAVINYVTLPGVEFLTLSLLHALYGSSVGWQDLWRTLGRKKSWRDASETGERFVFLIGQSAKKKRERKKRRRGKGERHCRLLGLFCQIVSRVFAGGGSAATSITTVVK